MKLDKHNASLILVGVIVTLFFVFIIVAGFFAPDDATAGIEDSEAKALAESLAAMVWWMTVAVIILPIMMVLIVLAAYLFITEDRASRFLPARPEPAPVQAEKVKEATTPYDVLDLRYARGEITRDQYVSMKADMKILKV
ncbi:MAG: hypothetical protein ISF22_03460 [Methanomassiliicoccus sp.]|nr:hypothetical protein [Methanomassiliicoccus sp.]